MNWFWNKHAKLESYINTTWSQHPDCGLFTLASSRKSAETQVWCSVDPQRTKYHGRWQCYCITAVLLAQPAGSHTAVFCDSCAFFCCCAAACVCLCTFLFDQMHKQATDILHHVDIVLFWRCGCVCIPGVERWPGKPWRPVPGHASVSQLHNWLTDWLHIFAKQPGLSAQYTVNWLYLK